ncbi:MAG: hypothetical protein ACNA8P_00130 [Phycisphaerales bacterium]
MNKRSYKGLLTLNVLLVAVLVLVSIGPSDSEAQQANRARGQYSALSMAVTGSVSDAIVVIDANNQEMVALRWDASRRSLAGIDYVSLQVPTGTGGGGTRR